MLLNIDFIIDLPPYDSNNTIFTCFDHLTKQYMLITCFVKGALSISLDKLFFDNLVSFFSIPSQVISDRVPRFTTSFWLKI